jgi:hypothetical protein
MIMSLAQQDEYKCKRIISIEIKYFIHELTPCLTASARQAFGAVSKGTYCA